MSTCTTDDLADESLLSDRTAVPDHSGVVGGVGRRIVGRGGSRGNKGMASRELPVSSRKTELWGKEIKASAGYDLYKPSKSFTARPDAPVTVTVTVTNAKTATDPKFAPADSRRTSAAASRHPRRTRRAAGSEGASPPRRPRLDAEGVGRLPYSPVFWPQAS